VQKGFLGSLFDVSFTSLVTTRIIKVLYILVLIGVAVLALVYTVIAFQVSAGLGILTLLVLAPLGSLLSIVYSRVLLEAVIALFRIMENTQAMAQHGGGAGASGGGSTPPASAGTTGPTPTG